MSFAPETIDTRDGARLLVRQIEPGDREALREQFEHLSPESRYRRFLSTIKHLSERELTRLTEVDHADHEALVAIAGDGELVGVARYMRLAEGSDRAEVAVTVADAWQGRGVGTALLSRLIVRAEDEGIFTFVASCLARNEDMIVLFRHLGESVRRTGSYEGTVELEIELPTDADHLVGPTLRAAANAPTLAPAESATPG